MSRPSQKRRKVCETCPPVEIGTLLIRSVESYEWSRNAVLLQGLPLLSAVVRTREHESLVEMIRTCIMRGVMFADSSWHGDWIEDATGGFIQGERAQLWPSAYDVFHNTRVTMAFEKDGVDCPPLAWVTLWKGRYSNIFGSFVPEALRRWGYVMWDAERLGCGAKSFLLAEWEAMYGNSLSEPVEDPRDRDIADWGP